jgi:hypothetical protein
MTSVVPSSVRKAVVNSWGYPADSVWKSIFPGTTWPLLDGDEIRGCVCRTAPGLKRLPKRHRWVAQRNESRNRLNTRSRNRKLGLDARLR